MAEYRHNSPSLATINATDISGHYQVCGFDLASRNSKGRSATSLEALQTSWAIRPAEGGWLGVNMFADSARRLQSS